jgi:hypothetical protein
MIHYQTTGCYFTEHSIPYATNRNLYNPMKYKLKLIMKQSLLYFSTRTEEIFTSESYFTQQEYTSIGSA